LNCSLEITVIPDEDHLLLLFQYVWFSLGTKVNLHGSGKLKVIRVVMGQRQREVLVDNKR
jgi:hypothetical protein